MTATDPPPSVATVMPTMWAFVRVVARGRGVPDGIVDAVAAAVLLEDDLVAVTKVVWMILLPDTLAVDVAGAIRTMLGIEV